MRKSTPICSGRCSPCPVKRIVYEYHTVIAPSRTLDLTLRVYDDGVIEVEAVKWRGLPVSLIDLGEDEQRHLAVHLSDRRVAFLAYINQGELPK